MEKLLRRIWVASLLVVCVAIFTIFSFNERLATDILRSLFNGEASVGFWMKHDVPFIWAVTIGIACSTYDILCWVMLFRLLQQVYPKSIRPVYERIYGGESLVANAQTPWLMKAHSIGEWIYRSCVPQPEQVAHAHNGERGPHYYWPLVFYGVCPGSIWTGVSYTLAFQLNLVLGTAVLVGANAVKIASLGYLACVTNAWIVVAIVLATPIVRKWIVKYLNATRTVAPVPQPDFKSGD